ncbi:Ig-like domain-containing protein [Paenibacillus wynnii]|uniref:Ig-like domain-containing protein n=1 Tax=Paenibacillus wynnii TaxID=268407 RepID=UPI00068BD723|nr:Ig-like domain-containing protein [Paenibacillus wynnii]
MFDLFSKSDTDNYEFIQSQIGSDVLINDSSTVTRALVTNTNLEQNYDDKKISSLSPLNRGDLVVYEGKKYMIISEINTQRSNKFKGIMRRLPHTVIVNSACHFIHVDCYITVSNLGVTEGKVLSVLDGEITVFTKEYYKELGLKIDSKFFVDGQKFKVTGIDTFSKKGILILSCEKDSIDTVADDVINGIAGGLSCTVDITNASTSVMIGNTLQLAWTSTNNVPVTFTSSSNAIATVSATGLVTGVTEGSFTVTVANSTNGFIYDTLAISVYAPEVYTMSLYNTVNKHNMAYNEQIIINKNVYLNGATITDKTVTYSLVYADQITAVPSTVATISVDSDNIATVTNLNAGTVDESIYVKAVLDNNNSIVNYYALTLAYQVTVTKTITLSPMSATYVEITSGSSVGKTFTATVSSGVENCGWAIFADDKVSSPDPTVYSILSQTTSTIQIKGLKYTYYIQLKCYLLSDPSVSTWQRIRIKSAI